jgi:signal transduction histidine kinase
LQQVALVLNRTLDQKQVVAAILDQLQGIIPYDGATLWLVDGENLTIVEAAGLSLRRVGWGLPLGSNSPQALVVRNRQPRVSADVTREPEWPRWDKEGLIHSWLGVPLLAGQEVIGLLSLVKGDLNAYDQEDLQVLQSFASQAVIAISNAQLYQQVDTARERLSILYQASQVISAATLVPQQIYAEIHAAVARLMPADVFVVTLINEAEQEAEDVYLVDQGQVWPGRRYPLSGTFAHYLLRRGISLRADDYSTIPQEEFKFELFGILEDTRSGLAVLLRGRDRVLGLLSVQSYELATYTGDDLELLELLAAHAAIALENTRLYQQAQTAAVLEERNRLARDLHDSVTQSLYSLTLLAEGWRRLAQRGRLPDVDSALAELGEIAQQSLKEMRLLIFELRPPVLEQAGLLGALHQRLGAVERRAGVEARLIAEELVKVPPQVEQGLYHITQEALNNALKHARATTVTVFVRANGAWIEVEVTDNGCGFEPERLNGQSGLGLISMRERAEQLRGEVVIVSKPGEGTTVKVRVKGNS